MNNSLEKQKYTSCELIEHGIMFDHCNVVRVCSIVNREYNGKPVIFHNYHGELFDKEKLFEIKRKLRNLMKNGTPPHECTGCHFLIEKEWDDGDYIDNLLFAHWLDCNSKCIYCLASTDEAVKRQNQHYDIYPAIKDLVERNILVSSGKVDFAGGEPTIYPEFEKLLHLFIEYKFKEICVNTSGIKYSPAIYRALEEGMINLTISVDAGSKEVHEKVKRVQSFDKVWGNIAEYSKAQKKSDNQFQMCLKYLVVPDVNDTLDEFDKFFDKVIENDVKSVALSLDMFWYEEHKSEDNSELNRKFDYFIDRAKNKLGLDIRVYPWAEWSLIHNNAEVM